MANDKVNIALFADLPDCCTYVNTQVLAAGVAETLTVPTGYDCVLFSATADFYLRVGSAAAVAGADVTDGTGSALNPTGRRGIRGQTLSVISPSACILTQEYFRVG